MAPIKEDPVTNESSDRYKNYRQNRRARQRLRAGLIAGGLSLLALAVALILFALEDSVVFFYGPGDVAAGQVPPQSLFRLGGLVAYGSVANTPDGAITFVIEDGVHAVPVTYRGLLPDLFREGQGIVALGMLDDNGQFKATEVLAKHDETYMPPEAVEALKRSGTWRGGE